VALTYDKASGVGTIYVNGDVVAQQMVGQFTPQTSYDLYFGLRPSSPFGDAGTRFSGLMDEIELFNRALAPAEVQAIVNTSSAHASLVGWWPADGNANDIQGGNNGTLQGGMTFSTGAVGQAFSFNGTDADVKVPASAATNVGTSGGFTVGAWINPNDLSSFAPLVEWNNNANGIGAHFWLFPGGVIFANIFDDVGGEHSLQSASNAVSAGVFQHVVLTYDKASGVGTIYVNGDVVAQQMVGQFTPQTSYDLYFGLRPSSPFGDAGTRFSGLMDEIELFNRALAPAEIQAIVQTNIARFCQVVTVTGHAPPSAAFTMSFPVAATGGGSGNPVVIAASGACSGGGNGSATITMTSGAGVCSVTYNQAGNASYSAAVQVTETTSAVPASQSIAFGPLPNAKASQSPITVSATASSGLIVTFTATTPAVCTAGGMAGATITLLASGTCTVVAHQPGNTNYLAAADVAQLFTVGNGKADQTITFGPLPDRTLLQSPFTVSATASSGLTVSFTTTTAAVCTASGKNGVTITLNAAGTCTITASQSGGPSYNPAPPLSQSFTVTVVDQTITFAPLPNRTIAQSPITVSATASSGLPVRFTTTTSVCASVGKNGATIILITVGTCTVEADQRGNTTYNPAQAVRQSFTVTP
jgi:hypothetical protein